MRFIPFFFVIGFILPEHMFSQKYIRLDNIIKRDFNCVYDIEFLKANISLLATDNGIYIFDGVKILPYIELGKLPSNEVLDMYVDSKNRLWFNFFNGSIGYVDINHLDRKEMVIIHKTSQPYNNIFEWHDEIYFMYFRHFTIYSPSNKSHKTIYNKNIESGIPSYFTDSIGFLQFGKIRYFSTTQALSFPSKFSKFSITQKNKIIQLNKFRSIHINKRAFLTLIKSDLTLYTDSSIKKLNYKHLGLSQELLVAFAYNYKTKTAYCGGYNTGLYKIKYPFSDNPEISSVIPDYSITSLKFDEFNNLFVGTSTQGLIIIPYTSTIISDINLLTKNSLVTSNFNINRYKHYYLASDEYCNYHLFDDKLNTITNGNFNISKNKYGTIRSFSYSNHFLYLGTDLGLIKINIQTKEKKFFSLNSVKAITSLDENTLLIGSSLGLQTFEKPKDKQNWILLKRIKKIASVNDSTFLILTNDSLIKLKIRPKNNNPHFEYINVTNLKGIKDLRRLSNGSIFMISNTGVLHNFHNGKFISPIIKSDDTANFVKLGEIYKDKIYFIHHGGIFCSQFSINNGIYTFTKEKIINNLTSLKQENLNNFEILPDGQLLVSYFGRLEVIPNGIDTIIDEKVKPQLYSARDKNNLIYKYSPETTKLEFGENDLPINLTYLSPSNYSTKFYYKINGLTEFSGFDNFGFQITNLPPGEYDLQVVSDTPSENDRNISHLQLIIKPNFYNRTIFKILISLLIFSILFGIAFYLYEINESKLRVEFDKRLMLHENNKLKLDILRTQMNPHFNFNALQTVIRVLQKGDLKLGTEYLFKISQLQRRILESTKKEFIDLSEEIEILKLYLDIEIARFSKQLVIDFSIDDSIEEENFEIPPMIIQPLIENAIWHGLSENTIIDKKLEISFKIEMNQLIVIVSDNGLGMDLKNMNNRSENSNHNSIGIKNIIQRIENLNSTVKKYSFSLNFASSMDVGSSGTTVTYIQTFRT